MTAQRQTNQRANGLKMADVEALPDSERQLVLWMLETAAAVSLSEVSAYLDLGKNKVVASTILDYLLQRGFLQLLESGGQPRYKIAFRHPDSSPDTITQISPGQPLALIVNPSGAQTVVAGSKFELCVTVINKGNQSALIDLSLDDSTYTVRQWCSEPNKRLALNSNSSSEVIFEFLVPIQTLIGTYNYNIKVDAPQHYPEDTPILHPQRLQVLPPVETAIRVSDPTFTLQPVTTSQTPTPVRPGDSFSVNVSVYNRSDRVDRFRITCPDIPENWYKVIYPQGLEQIGMLIAPDALDLNPGARGDILLLLTPGLNAVAGNYFPSVRLHSANNPNLALMDVVYLQVLPVYALNAEFLILRSRVRNQEGIFHLKLNNSGNTTREVLIRTQTADDKELCTYTVEPDAVRLLPNSSTNIDLRVKPNKWWRRPVYGAPELIEFRVQLEDTQQLPLPDYIPQGTLIWEPRPWWQFLLLFIAGVGTLGAIAFLIWATFFKPPAQPKIVEFAADNNLYQEVNNDFIRLNWQVRNPRQIYLLKLTGQSTDGTASVAPIVYDFSKGIPNELKESCSWRSVLICQNMRTDARLPGEYIFNLQVFSKSNQEVAADALKTNPIKIIPIKIIPLPIPKILEFSSDQPIYEAARLNAKPIIKVAPGKANPGNYINKSILLNWQISNPEQINQLKLTGQSTDGTASVAPIVYDFSKGIPNELKESCSWRSVLTCQNMRTDARLPGEYIFNLQVFSKSNQEVAADALKTNPIKIIPLPIPKILEFSSDQPIYEAARLNAKPIIKVAPGKANPSNYINKSILLNWQISNPEQINQLKIIAKAADGTANIPVASYDLSQGINRKLKQSCQVGDTLICKNVPTGIKEAGNYTFELIILSPQGQAQPADAKKIDNIQIKPQLPQIVEFKVNGKDAPAKYLFPIVGAKIATNMNISWKVEGGKDLKVELLPAPGTVPVSGNISYPLSDKPSIVTLTLQVKSSASEPITRAVTIETFVLQPAPNSGATSAPAVGAPTPAEPDLLSPVELPPKFD
ncbi:hypothetical protein NIES4072_64890 [Nostoc commune NIES-4072]|uniref:Uncharacterized protein n=1 Tax=Nostoc commune NIES-4072 TaxID=2005467 RepID=A0A2R5FVK7_NOSCO|nr:hypothetical protein [Nostoc commune]BBD70124.1 hypothetical protein NIES4070_65350 [Nostoc commune HK-02]GBG22777.1 hypothetical protein NIES4072_64890 [Nostoc commune NIES-4072]